MMRIGMLASDATRLQLKEEMARVQRREAVS